MLTVLVATHMYNLSNVPPTPGIDAMLQGDTELVSTESRGETHEEQKTPLITDRDIE